MSFPLELVVLHTMPSCSASFQCMLGGSVEACMKNILEWFIGGQTQFGMQSGAKMSLALNEPK